MFSVQERSDGFGGQFQTMINAICIVEENNLGQYIHIPIKSIEHNYDNDPKFLEKIEDLMNLKKYYTPSTLDISNAISDGKIVLFNTNECISRFNQNLDYYIKSETMKKLKNIFWQNKERPFKNHSNNIVAVHIRRQNSNDNRIDGTNTHLNYYINKMELILRKYPESIFYIYSQKNDVDDYSQIPPYFNVVYRIDAPLFETFTELVDADVLVMSRSSLSYTAALLSDGEIYYNPYWEKPASFWLKYFTS
jgi:hypothetical protein